MTSPKTILENLKNLNQYLAQFDRSEQSTYFEKFIAEVLSRILNLPFYTMDDDNTAVPHRIIWQGSTNPVSKAPLEKPDVVAYCYDFCLTIEATLKTGVNQWTQEFASSIRHCANFCSQSRIQEKDAIALLICTKLHEDTYRSIKSNPKPECKLIPIEVSELVRILETSILAFTMRHLEFRRLLNQVSDCIRTSSSLDNFQSDMDILLTNWQKDVLKIERSAIISVKSYEAMRSINRTHISVGEIFSILLKDQTINEYLRIIGDKLSFDIIEESLLQQGLAFQFSPTFDEKLFYPVPFADFKERGLRLIKAVEEGNGSLQCR